MSLALVEGKEFALFVSTRSGPQTAAVRESGSADSAGGDRPPAARLAVSCRNTGSSIDKIGVYSFQTYLAMVESFHGSESPGVILGGIMVDYALSEIPAGILFEAICETNACLPDAIQLLTPCTTGNGRLKLVNFGRFALTLYEKYEGRGVRIFVNPAALGDRGEIRNWLYKLKAKSEQNQRRLIDEMRLTGRGILGMHPVRIKPQNLGKKSKGAIADCVMCGEPYPEKDGPLCLACRGESPYI